MLSAPSLPAPCGVPGAREGPRVRRGLLQQGDAETLLRGLSPCGLAALRVGRGTWGHPFRGGSRAVFFLGDSELEGWEKIGNVSLES